MRASAMIANISWKEKCARAGMWVRPWPGSLSDYQETDQEKVPMTPATLPEKARE